MLVNHVIECIISRSPCILLLEGKISNYANISQTVHWTNKKLWCTYMYTFFFFSYKIKKIIYLNKSCALADQPGPFPACLRRLSPAARSNWTTAAKLAARRCPSPPGKRRTAFLSGRSAWSPTACGCTRADCRSLLECFSRLVSIQLSKKIRLFSNTEDLWEILIYSCLSQVVICARKVQAQVLYVARVIAQIQQVSVQNRV